MSKEHYRKKSLAILVGGGPAPGINGVIRSVTIEAINSGLNVIGILDGYSYLIKGDPSHVRELRIDDVSRIHFSGGSILGTSRENPATSKEKLEAEAKQLNASVQEQLRQFKQDLLLRLETIKGQLSNSQKDLTELKEFVKTEFTAVLDDLTKLGKELKGDVSEISVKHKDQLTETFKRSKENTLDAWNKVSSK